MKPLDAAKTKWAHIVCVNWHPEIWFTNDFKNQVGGKVAPWRYDLNCTRCKQKDGACIQCDFRTCGKSYHVRCAIKSGMIKEWDTMQEQLGNPADDQSTPVFC